MNYNKYNLSELFDKIDTLLQRYFGKEDDYNFYEKDKDARKTDLSKKIEVLQSINFTQINDFGKSSIVETGKFFAFQI